jgi:hypothetical protein
MFSDLTLKHRDQSVDPDAITQFLCEPRQGTSHVWLTVLLFHKTERTVHTQSGTWMKAVCRRMWHGVVVLFIILWQNATSWKYSGGGSMLVFSCGKLRHHNKHLYPLCISCLTLSYPHTILVLQWSDVLHTPNSYPKSRFMCSLVSNLTVQCGRAPALFCIPLPVSASASQLHCSPFLLYVSPISQLQSSTHVLVSPWLRCYFFSCGFLQKFLSELS